MSVFIGIEDLAANALIALFNNNKKDFVSFEELTNYGAKVVEILSNKSEKGVLIFTKNIAETIEQNKSSYFKTFIENQKQYIKLKDNVTVNDIIKKYRACLSVEVLIAFTCKESLKALGMYV